MKSLGGHFFKYLEHIKHLFVAVIGVADESLALRADAKIERFQRNLADHRWGFCGIESHSRC